MQKIKYLLSLLFLSSFYLQAADTSAVTPSGGQQPPGAPASPATPVPLTAGQDPIVRALQDDIVFEREKRQLSNELALEKLRAELQKVRGESAPVTVMPVAPPPVAMPAEPVVRPVTRDTVVPPSVVLVSQVAGVSRVGVSVNGQMRFIGRHETFTAGGKHYRLAAEKNGQLVVREVK